MQENKWKRTKFVLSPCSSKYVTHNITIILMTFSSSSSLALNNQQCDQQNCCSCSRSIGYLGRILETLKCIISARTTATRRSIHPNPSASLRCILTFLMLTWSWSSLLSPASSTIPTYWTTASQQHIHLNPGASLRCILTATCSMFRSTWWL